MLVIRPEKVVFIILFMRVLLDLVIEGARNPSSPDFLAFLDKVTVIKAAKEVIKVAFN